MTNYAIYHGEKASRHFIDAFKPWRVFGPEIHCDFCSRTHYMVDDAYAFNPNSKEMLHV